MKIDKKTTVVGFADALQQTLDIIAKKMNEQQVQINTLHIQIDNIQRELDEKVNKIDQSLNVLDEIQNPTLFDK